MQIDIFQAQGAKVMELHEKLMYYLKIEHSVRTRQLICYDTDHLGRTVQIQMVATIVKEDFLPEGITQADREKPA